MDTKSVVIAQIRQIAEEMAIQKDLPPLTDDLVLTSSGLDSLAIAILVTRLEDTLEVDPFTESSDFSYPVTLGDFIELYENTRSAKANSQQDR